MDKLIFSDCLRFEVLGMCTSGVYGIFEEESKTVFVSCSNNLLKGIGNVVTRIKEDDHICSNMKNGVLQVLYVGKNQRLEGSKIIDKLLREGYKVLNKVVPIILVPRIRSLPLNGNLIAVVTLRSSRGNETIVGAFSLMSEARQWMNTEYPEGIVNSIVFENSALTKECKEYYD